MTYVLLRVSDLRNVNFRLAVLKLSPYYDVCPLGMIPVWQDDIVLVWFPSSLNQCTGSSKRSDPLSLVFARDIGISTRYDKRQTKKSTEGCDISIRRHAQTIANGIFSNGNVWNLTIRKQLNFLYCIVALDLTSAVTKPARTVLVKQAKLSGSYIEKKLLSSQRSFFNFLHAELWTFRNVTSDRKFASYLAFFHNLNEIPDWKIKISIILNILNTIVFDHYC